MARNIPYSATLNALTIRAGSKLPMKMPSAVPAAHIGMDAVIAP